MKRGLNIIIMLLMPVFILAQNNYIGLEYSFDVLVSDDDIRKKMEENNFSTSKSFKVYYTDKGVARYIEQPNNYIQSSLFNNNNNKLVLFNEKGIINKTTGFYNQPSLISSEKNNPTTITYKTTSGTYTYSYSDTLPIVSLNIDNLKEHCFDLFTKETNTLPTKIRFSFGIITVEITLMQIIPLEEKDYLLINKVINKPNKKNIKLFREFAANSDSTSK